MTKASAFKVGDKVKCLLKDGHSFIEVGNVYTVDDVSSTGNIDLLEIRGFYYPKSLFEIVPAYNGVDADGKPVLFTVADLKPFQRVVTVGGEDAIVTMDGDGKVALTFPDGFWNDAYFDDRGTGNGIVKVYCAPEHGCSLDTAKRGPLIFKATNAAAESAAALAALEAAIESATFARDLFIINN